ncbi:MAG: 1-acyl-sn-glycerol-3-phosphate acyltransferase [Treponema sp.]|jgi:1-acyl-sn-glycerol-3-phosphate acyltransferase|nr:1-acyl-sn-glycerol-3-phosphate acyltransferase [Treponema sp.]
MIKTIICFFHAAVSMVFVTPLGLIATLLSPLGLRKQMSVIMYYIAMGWALLLIKVIGCKVTVTGRENIPKKSGVCLVSNHGSIFDIVLLLAYSRRMIGFIAKKELLFIPILNIWISILGGLFLDRKNGRKAIRTFNKGIARLKDGGGMIIFPEGHRSRGQGLLPFHPGALKLATQSEVVIVPVAIKDSYEVFERNYRANPVPVRITFCKPINTADIPVTGRKMLLSDQIYSVIKEALSSD